MLSETQICETSGQSSNLNNGKGNKYCDIPVHCRVGFCQKTFLVQTNHRKILSYQILQETSTTQRSHHHHHHHQLSAITQCFQKLGFQRGGCRSCHCHSRHCRYWGHWCHCGLRRHCRHGGGSGRCLLRLKGRRRDLCTTWVRWI